MASRVFYETFERHDHGRGLKAHATHYCPGCGHGLVHRDGILQPTKEGKFERPRFAERLRRTRREVDERLGPSGKSAKARRQDADDFPRLVVQAQRLSNNAGIGIESPLPQRIGDQGDSPRTRRRIELRRKVTTSRNPDAEG